MLEEAAYGGQDLRAGPEGAFSGEFPGFALESFQCCYGICFADSISQLYRALKGQNACTGPSPYC